MHICRWTWKRKIISTDNIFPNQVGARGVVGRSTDWIGSKIGLTSRERTKAVTRMYEGAWATSFWIWQMRSQKSSEATSGKPEKAIDLRWQWSNETTRPNSLAERWGNVGRNRPAADSQITIGYHPNEVE